jgi:hypothetical protein
MSNDKLRELNRYSMAIQCKEWDDSKEGNEPKLIPYPYETGEWIKYSDITKIHQHPKAGNC